MHGLHICIFHITIIKTEIKLKRNKGTNLFSQ